MITKTQLQEGCKFTYGKYTYKFSSTTPESEFYYVESLSRNDVRYGYVGNVDSMDDESFTLYTYVMDIHKVEIKIYYADCELAS
jgi:hypothetical protein